MECNTSSLLSPIGTIAMFLKRVPNVTLTGLASTHIYTMERHLLFEEGLQGPGPSLRMKMMPSMKLGGAKGACSGKTLTHHEQPQITTPWSCKMTWIFGSVYLRSHRVKPDYFAPHCSPMKVLLDSVETVNIGSGKPK